MTYVKLGDIHHGYDALGLLVEGWKVQLVDSADVHMDHVLARLYVLLDTLFEHF